MRRRWVIWLPAVVLLVAACGGGESTSEIASLQEQEADTAGSTTAAAAVDPDQAILDFAACMREHGIDMPDPEINSAGGGFGFTIQGEASDGSGPDQAEMQKMQDANEACSHFLEGVVSEFEPVDMTKMQDQMLAFSQCMRDNGIDYPDPEFSDDGGVTIIGGEGFAMDPSDPAFQAAQEACQEIFGGGGPGFVIGGDSGGPGGAIIVGPGESDGGFQMAAPGGGEAPDTATDDSSGGG